MVSSDPRIYLRQRHLLNLHQLFFCTSIHFSFYYHDNVFSKSCFPCITLLAYLISSVGSNHAGTESDLSIPPV